MRIEELQSSLLSPLLGVQQEQKDSGDSLSFKSNSGDTVAISTEARERYAAMVAASHPQAESEQQSQEEEESAGDQLAQYMSEARGEVSSGGSAEDQLEKLKAQLQKLEEKKAQVLQSDSMSPEEKESMVQAIDAEINALMSQIAELTTQAAAGEGE